MIDLVVIGEEGEISFFFGLDFFTASPNDKAMRCDRGQTYTSFTLKIRISNSYVI